VSAFGRSDSPPPSWYEPPDEPEDADPADDDLSVHAGVCSWFALLAHDVD
jgi:hypothetical protein